jgi:hypothetical protein
LALAVAVGKHRSQVIDFITPHIGIWLALDSGMYSHEVFTLLAASATVCVSLGFAVSQYRAWTRALRSRRLTARLLEWDGGERPGQIDRFARPVGSD